MLSELNLVDGNSLFFSVVEGDCCGVFVVVNVRDEDGGVVVDGDLHGVIMDCFWFLSKVFFSELEQSEEFFHP